MTWLIMMDWNLATFDGLENSKLEITGPRNEELLNTVQSWVV